MSGVTTVLFTPQVYIATFAEHIKGKRRKNYKSNNYFPHSAVSNKKDPRP